MDSKKGFTLIELLAVIVILAIIALIATPIVIGVINKARENSVVNSAYGVVDAAKLYYTESLLSSTQVSSGDVSSLNVSGTKPSAGTWSITTDGQVTISGVKFDGYTCSTKSGSSEVSCAKDGATS